MKDMIRSLLVLLLIANVLACPLRCLGCQITAADESDREEIGCLCCQPGATSQAPESSGELPGDDCTCPNCICEGATLESTPQPPEVEAYVIAWISLAIDAPATQSPAVRHPGALDLSDQPHRLAGRDARIAHQSWLL